MKGLDPGAHIVRMPDGSYGNCEHSENYANGGILMIPFFQVPVLEHGSGLNRLLSNGTAAKRRMLSVNSRMLSVTP